MEHVIRRMIILGIRLKRSLSLSYSTILQFLLQYFYRVVLPPHRLTDQPGKPPRRAAGAGRSRKEIASARRCGCNRLENVNRGDNDPVGVVHRAKIAFSVLEILDAMYIKVIRFAKGRAAILTSHPVHFTCSERAGGMRSL